MDRLALANQAPTLPSPDVISKVLLGGDLAQLTPQQQISYYRAVCDSLGLNPLTKPFEFLRLSGRLVLYATRNATDQLRHRYAISVQIVAREFVEDLYVVTARASFPDGRHDESIGAVPIAGLKGEARANAVMKGETKSKRRVTLSLVGLSTLDESEVDSIPGAQPVNHIDPNFTKSLTPSPGPAVTDAVIADPGLGVSATPANTPPADLNQAVPDSWQPFVQKTAITGMITAGTRSKTTGKTTLTITTGMGGLVQCYTTDHDMARAVTRFKEGKTPVTVTVLDNGEIVTLAEATDAAF